MQPRAKARTADRPLISTPEPAAHSLAVLLGYLALFAAVSWRWLAGAATGLPREPYPADGFLIVQILSWVGYALTNSPGQLFDAPFNHPAPAQLTGSEHFLTAQLLFLPLERLTANPLLAANLVAFACGPLAAFFMNRLLASLGYGLVTCWTGGLLFAFAQDAFAFSLHSLQIPQLYLPLAALLARRLRQRACLRRATLLALAVGAGLFASYYQAVMLLLALAAWLPYELLRRPGERGRFAALALAAVVLPALALLVFSRPYFERPEARGAQEISGRSRWGVAHLDPQADAPKLPVHPSASAQELRSPWSAGFPWDYLAANLVLDSAQLVCALLALVGMARGAALGFGSMPAAAPATAIAALGLVFSLGRTIDLGGHTISLPLAWLSATPLRFIRAPIRYLALASFGYSLLAAFAIDAVCAPAARRRPWLAAALATVAVLLGVPALGGALAEGVSRAMPAFGIAPLEASWRPRLAPEEMIVSQTMSEHRTIYRALAAYVAEQGRGPLLELPVADVQREAIVGAAIHHQPALSSYTGYEPPHRPTIDKLLRRVPEATAVEALHDLTGLRWILVRPAADWPSAVHRERILASLLRHPTVESATAFGELVLIELAPLARPSRWFNALARGPRRGETVLGTPLLPLAEPAAIAEISGPPRLSTFASWYASLPLKIVNAGSQDWPVAAPSGAVRPPTVHLEAHWSSSGGEPVGPPVEIPLLRDLPAGEALLQSATLTTPLSPGSYVLEIRPAQSHGASFTAPGNRPLRVQVTLRPLPRQGGDPPAPATAHEEPAQPAPAGAP